MKKITLNKIFFLAIIIYGFLLLNIKFNNEEVKVDGGKLEIYQTTCGDYEKADVKISFATLQVDISDDNCKRQLGLSGKTSLNGEGMLFVFEKVGNYGFWMKDMNFPIDILWIDDKFSITGIENIILPETYPNTFGEKYLGKYVLEIPPGYAEKNNIKVGDKIILEEK